MWGMEQIFVLKPAIESHLERTIDEPLKLGTILEAPFFIILSPCCDIRIFMEIFPNLNWKSNWRDFLVMIR
jgi:hypothetical protein